MSHMIKSRGWAHDDDLFGRREIGQSDQVSFLILVVPRLLLRGRRSSAEWRRSTRSVVSRVSRSAQMQAASMPRQITKRKIQPVDFVQGLRVNRSPYGASMRTIVPSTAIPSRKVVLRSLTETPKMRLEELVVRSPAART